MFQSPMNLIWALVIGLGFLWYLNRRVKKHREQAKPSAEQMRKLKANALSGMSQKLKAYLHKTMLPICLAEDGKVYGFAYQNSDPPPLPHGEGCRCAYYPSPTSLQSFFPSQSKKGKEGKFATDLGELGFLEYKYYKYSLLAAQSGDTAQQRDYYELRAELKVGSGFQNKVRAHLGEATANPP